MLPPSLPLRRGLPAIAWVLIASMLLAGCSSTATLWNWMGGRVVVTEAQLQGWMERRFPRDFEVGHGLAAVVLEKPQARLEDEQLHMAFELQATAVGLRLPLRGAFAFRGGLRFDPESQSLYLHEPQLVRLDLPRVPGMPAEEELLGLGDALLAEYARSEPIYVLSERRQQQVPRGRSVYRVDIERDRLVIGVRR